MNFFNKFSTGAWFAFCGAILAIASLVVYRADISSEGYFQNAAVTNFELWCALGGALLLLAIILCLANKGRFTDLLGGCCQIAAPAVLALALINLVAARIEGLGFIYFSNADVLLEVQTEANLASASGAIANIALLGIGMLVAILSAFSNLRKKKKHVY